MSQFGRIVKLLKVFFFLCYPSVTFHLIPSGICIISNNLIINSPDKHNKKCSDPSKENLSVDNKT